MPSKKDSFSLTGTRSNFNSIINDNILAGYLENFQYIIIKSERNRRLELEIRCEFAQAEKIRNFFACDKLDFSVISAIMCVVF